MADGDRVDQEALMREIRERFDFLSAFEFGIDTSDSNGLVWTSGDRFVTIARDWRDGHIDVTFSRGRAGHRTEFFSLDDALAAVGAAGDWPTHGWQAVRHDVALRFVNELAALLRAYAGSLLPLGSAGWAAAAALASERARALTVESAVGPVRSSADAAWRAKDWAAVVELYQAMQSGGAELTGSERKRLAYAQARR